MAKIFVEKSSAFRLGKWVDTNLDLFSIMHLPTPPARPKLGSACLFRTSAAACKIIVQLMQSNWQPFERTVEWTIEVFACLVCLPQPSCGKKSQSKQLQQAIVVMKFYFCVAATTSCYGMH
ncbi:unnamed protein product [Ceratitis capitata]|uniref:(Mediterranean fruit fly) hypothetical protein n=1 Tax=Ceratitis capitata TaxID=7213 RepID=A0A811V339_CERCA|nr:unnamed protein product [Ceratitis capitata]